MQCSRGGGGRGGNTQSNQDYRIIMNTFYKPLHSIWNCIDFIFIRALLHFLSDCVISLESLSLKSHCTNDVGKHLCCHSTLNCFQMGLDMVQVFIWCIPVPVTVILVSRSSYYHEQFLPDKSSDSCQFPMGSMLLYRLHLIWCSSIQRPRKQDTQLLIRGFWRKGHALVDSCLSHPQVHKTNLFTPNFLWVLTQFGEDLRAQQYHNQAYNVSQISTNYK